MPNVVGAIAVRLGLDAGEYTSGLTKSEYQAKQFADRLDARFRSLSRTIAGLGIGAAIGIFVRDTIASASALDDLSDSTGSSVESLSKLANQAKISGRDFSELQAIMLKLAAGMAGADDESSNVGRALKFLGVTARDPAQALQEVAQKLNTYADGIGKAALARDLFGKGGPAFLATLKDIAEASDVAATVTAKQAAEAEALEKALRRLSVEGTTLKDVILSDVVPWLNTMLEQFREGTKLAGGFGNALLTLGTINPFKSSAENIADYTRRLDALKAGTGAESFFARIFGTKDEVQRQLEVAKAFEQLRQRQQAMAGAVALGFTGDVRDVLANRKPAANYTGGKDAAAKLGVDEFAKALQNVSKMAAVADEELKAAFSGEQILPARRALAALRADDVWKTFTENQKETIKFAYEGVAASEASAAALRKEREEREKEIKVLQDQQDAQEKAREKITANLGSFAEQNDVLEKQIGIIGQGDGAWQKLNAQLEQNKRINEALAADVGPDVIKLLDDQYQRQLKLIDAYQQTADALRQQQEYNRIFVDSFADAVTGVVTGTKSISQAFNDMERSIVAAISRIAAQRIAETIFGVGSGGGGGIGGFFAGLFGGGFGHTAPGAGSAGNSLFDALGISVFGSGTDYATGGVALVGERGPELINIPRGAQVIPNSELMNRRAGKSISINQQINVLPGASRQSATQAAAAAAREARIAAIRNG